MLVVRTVHGWLLGIWNNPDPFPLLVAIWLSVGILLAALLQHPHG
jgi:hypothetical protein